jgi:glycosyltransferase involved in cell wall biosynthesis
MRIAIVDPYIRGMFGQRTHLRIAKILSKNNDVDFISYKVYEKLIDEVKNTIGKSNLIMIKKGYSSTYEFPYSLKYMYGGIVDLILSMKIKKRNKNKDYDAILVISSAEGWWLGYFLKKLKKNGRPLICLHITDPPLGIDLNFYEKGKHTGFIKRIQDVFFLKFQKFRLKYFDIIFGQSEWTNSILEKYFDIEPVGKAGGVDAERFSPLHVTLATLDQYIVVPTVSLDDERKKIIRDLSNYGINMVLYGPNIVEGVPSLGYVSDEEMIRLVGNANAMFFLFDYESLGLIPLESLSLGTPVITEKKQGPFSELKDNEYVKFIDNINDIEKVGKLCKEALISTLDINDRMKIRSTVDSYSFENFANRIINGIEKSLLKIDNT